MQHFTDTTAFLRINQYRSELMGFAALYISFMHLFTELYPDLVGGVLGQILSRGNLGVEIFLVISGIGLYYSLSKNFNLQKFYTKRIWRVVIP